MATPARGFLVPEIDPPETTGPLWSVMVPTYNGDPRLEQTLRSVLAQDPGPDRMQIEVIDDHSGRGDPEGLVRRVGGGRVSFYRQPQNVGHCANFNTCIRRAKGEVVHILHDDDHVRPGFYDRLEAPLRSRPEVGAAFTRSIYARADGHWSSLSPVERPSPGIVEDWPFRIASGQRVTTPSVVVRRSTYEAVGGFSEAIRVGGEDWEMWVRIASRFPVWFEPEPLAVYRSNREESLTGEALGSARLAGDMLTMTDLVESYLSVALGPHRAQAALERARAMYAGWAIEAAIGLARSGDRRGSLDAFRLAWGATSPRPVARSIVRNLLRARGRRRG
jgi:glycosyltransferase involved in cell wall biosynthesis